MNKNQKKTRWSAVILGIAMMVGMILVSPSAKVDSLALGQAKVIPESAKIRDKADLNSNQIGSAEQGKTLDVISQTKGADGKVWYKVYIDGQTTGYIRGDLVNASGTIPEEGAASTQETKPEQTQESQSTTTTASSGNKTTVGSNNTQTSSTTETTQSTEATGNASANVSVSESKVIKAKVNSSSVRVRKGPGTNYDVAGNAPGNTEVSVTGETTDTDGKVWYQVSFNLNNATVNGFIRNDFLEILETMSEEAGAEPIEEEASVEEEEAELVTLDNEDYFLKYMQNGEGQMDWFLFDNIKGTSQSLTELLQAVETNTEVDQADADMLSKLKLIVIVMAVVIFLLFIIMTVLLFKLRDASYEEEEEDEEEEEEEEPVEERRGFRGRRKVREEEPEDEEDEEEEEEEPAAPKRGLFGRKKVVEEEEDEVVVPVKKAGPVVEEDEAGDTGAIDFMDVVDDDMVFDFIDNYKK